MQSVTEYSLKLASIPLNQLCFRELSILDYFRVFLIKITRRLFYIKKFGVRNFFLRFYFLEFMKTPLFFNARL